MEKLEEFAKDGDKSLSGLSVIQGFLQSEKPERQWFNSILNTFSRKTNELIDELINLSDKITDQKLDTGINISQKIGDSKIRTQSDQNSEFLSVLDFVKTGLGWSDVFQRALNYKRNGWTYLRVPAGVYQLDKSLRIYAKTVIILDAGVTLIHNSPDEMLFLNGDKGNTAYATGYNGDGQIYIQGYGAVIDCNGLLLNQYKGMMRLAHADIAVFEGFEIKNGRHAHNLELNSSQNVLCTKLKINDHRYDSGDKYESIQIDHATSEGLPEFGAYDNTPCRNITIEYCGFNNTATGVGCHGSTPVGKEHLNIRVVNNTFKNIKVIGVRGQSWLSSEVTGNIFTDLDNACRPIVMYGCTESKICWNILDDANITQQAIVLSDGNNGRCKNMEVSYNRSKASTALYIQAADNSDVFKNTLAGNIFISGGDGTKVNGNRGTGSITVRSGTSKTSIGKQEGVYTISDSGSLTEIDGYTAITSIDPKQANGDVVLLDDINNYSQVMVVSGQVASGDLVSDIARGWEGRFRVGTDFINVRTSNGYCKASIITEKKLNISSTSDIVRRIYGINRYQ